MAVLWVAFILASSGLHIVQGLPVNPSSRIYPQDSNGSSVLERWTAEGGLYAAIPALMLVCAAFGLLFGCTWCYRHKDCKIFTASVAHLHEARRSQPPDSGFSEPANNNISEDNNNGPISLREMQNIANNNAAAYIVSENEERNRASRESVVEFEPLPAGIGVVDPLERCADWFAGEDFPRSRLQYLREIGRGWFGRVVKGEIEDGDSTTMVAVKILNQNASLEDKARFLDEARLYRDLAHENLLPLIDKCIQEDPWILIFELCVMDLQQYLATKRPSMEALNESGVPLQLMCDISAALAYIHSRGYLYRNLWSGNILVRGEDSPRAVLGQYVHREPQYEHRAPECVRHPPHYTASSDVWSLGHVVWELCAWGQPPGPRPPPPDPPCPYNNHLYQVMQLCWNTNYEGRPTAAQIHALIDHLYTTYIHSNDASNDDGYGSSDFEERWQRLKPNTIPKIDEHVAIVHAPSTSTASQFTGSDQEYENAHTIQDSLSVEMDTAVSRSSSVMSDKDTMSVQVKSDSLTNLHGSLEDVRNIYLTHNETATLECHQGNIGFEESKENDRSDSSVDPWLKDIITDSQDDVSYFKDVSDVIKNLDNILNSEKTSSSESSHQASPSRDNLSLECKKESPMQTSMVKSPGISNFRNIMEMDFESKTDENNEECEEDDGDRDTIGTLSHSFERHSDTISQQTLENITPETPIKDLDITNRLSDTESLSECEQKDNLDNKMELSLSKMDGDLPNDISIDTSNYGMPKLKELCVASMSSIIKPIEHVIKIEDCQKSYDNEVLSIDNPETKSIDSNSTIRNETNIITLNNCRNNENEAKLNEEKRETNFPVSDLIENIEVNIKDTRWDKRNVLVDKLDDDQYNLIKDTNKKVFDNVEQNSNIPPVADIEPHHSIIVETKRKSTSPERNIMPDLISTPKIIDDKEISELVVKNKENKMHNPEKFASTILDENCDNIVFELSEESNLHLAPNEENNVSNLPSKFLNGVCNVESIVSPLKIQEIHLKKSDNGQKGNSFISASPVRNLLEQSESIPLENRFHISVDTHNNNKINNDCTRNVELSETLLLSPNNIIINEACKIDENKALRYDECSSEPVLPEPPETVQILSYPESLGTYHLNNSKEIEAEIDHLFLTSDKTIKSETKVQSNYNNSLDMSRLQQEGDIYGIDRECDKTSLTNYNETNIRTVENEQSCNSTVYLNLSNSKNVLKVQENNLTTTDELKYSETPATATIDINSSSINESTIYLDLPNIIKETNDFLLYEKLISSQAEDFRHNLLSSTPKGSNNSAENTLEAIEQETKVEVLEGETKIPIETIEDTTFVKPKNEFENISPCESPTKSHHTDTYDENSSVVLGSLENCTFESLKTIKCNSEVDLPKEELLAFSPNFSEINLETPSPLRDGNFLNEVPDIHPDELQFDEIVHICEPNLEPLTENTSESEELSSTEKHVSPSTPPNSPGNFLASTSQMKYLVDIDIKNTDSGVDDVIDEVVHLNEIELQMTTKLAMAENENNMNIEYSGPMNDETEDTLLRRSDNMPESILAGNGGNTEYAREGLAIDEERMKELRNELELKLPLAQVSGIEPAEWCPPPPPELVLAYGALSPIAEETRLQLSAYENDDHWNYSARTESSESYPEPCNNSTDDVTDLLTGLQSGLQQSYEHSTYTLQSKDNSINHTYTVPREVPSSSKEITMSADSLNASPLKIKEDTQSPVDDKTYTKTEEDKDFNCERLSQISPFLLSPTTDTSAPDNSDMAAGVSTVSKATVPTDAKSSKPSETQCLSKATSIDSWCSNDTLYNVEENFDDLAMDPDILDYEPENDKDKSDSEDTLTHNDGEKENSHCSTYIVHDSKSEMCDTFSPDSITANDNYTYTKAKTELATTTPSLITKSDFNDSNDTKNTQTKDLAYGTLMSGMPSYSNCTTELVSAMDDNWKLPQPELVRRSPLSSEINYTPPRNIEEDNISEVESPKFISESILKKMDSVEITCLTDNVIDTKFESPECPIPIEIIPVEMNDSPNIHLRNMALSVTSTPFLELSPDKENTESIPITLPQNNSDELGITHNIPNFNAFFQSAEIRPQDISSNVENATNSNERTTEVLLEGESESATRDSSEKTPSYSDFENSAVTKPQELNSKEQSSQSVESGVSSEEFTQFQNSVKKCPQDLSSLIDASSLFIKSERRCSELTLSSITNIDSDFTNQSECHVVNTDLESLVHNSSSYTNLMEPQNANHQLLNIYITDIDMEDENEQPHSIIITESPLTASKLTPNRTFDSHTKTNQTASSTFDSHTKFHQSTKSLWTNDDSESKESNENSTTGNADLELVNKGSTDIVLEQNCETLKEPSVAQTIDTENKSENSIVNNDNFGQSSNVYNINNEVYATINTISETFEELVESNVDENDTATLETNKDDQTKSEKSTEPEGFESLNSFIDDTECETSEVLAGKEKQVGDVNVEKITSATEDFLQNEKKFCELDSYLPLLSDIRFTGPATEIMSTSFTQDSPTEPTSPECDQDSKPDPSADILKEWDSDSDTHSTNSSSGEFIWKDGDGLETALVPSTRFEHQRDSGSQPSRTEETPGGEEPSSGSGDSGSGSEGDEVEFVPSSWDCRAAPSKSSLRSVEQPTLTQDSKKRVVFKRQKYHCVYEYPREAVELDVDSPAYLPDFSTYSDWDATSAEEAEIGYGQLFGAPNPLDLFPLRSGIAFGADYDEDFFISSSARPFESLGVMSTSSQFFPGMHVKAMLERDFPDVPDEFPGPVSPLPTPTLLHSKTPSLDFTTPDSGVEDITPGSLAEDDYKAKKLPEECWRTADSTSSSESVSPSSPGGSLGGLRHTRGRLKLDLPPSPVAPSPKHNRVFNFVLEKPKRQERDTTLPLVMSDDTPTKMDESTVLAEDTPLDTTETPLVTYDTPLVMTDDTPLVTTALVLPRACDDIMPEPTFSTFGKAQCKPQDAEKIVLTDDNVAIEEIKEVSKKVEPVKGEGTVLDSGDEDSGIESSSKATLERKAPNVS